MEQNTNKKKHFLQTELEGKVRLLRILWYIKHIESMTRPFQVWGAISRYDTSFY